MRSAIPLQTNSPCGVQILVFAITMVLAIVGSAIAASDDWYITSTGGTGGGFGKGDSRGALWSVSFINAQMGVASGDSGAFRTDDGGLTWKVLPIPMMVSGDGKVKGHGWYNICMASADEIWALGQTHPGGVGMTHMLRSLDGGQTWEEQLQGKLDHATRLYFPTPAVRWALDQHHAFHSTDAGKTWEAVYLTSHPWPWIYDLVELADKPQNRTCYAVGVSRTAPAGGGVVLKSEDSGLNWKALPLPKDTPALRRVSFLSPLEGWVAGDNGFILYTSDGGSTWDVRSLPATGQQMCALFMLPGGRGYAAYQSIYVQDKPKETTLFVTADGGRTWTSELGGSKSIHAICSLGPDLIWGVGVVPGFLPNDLVVIWKGK